MDSENCSTAADGSKICYVDAGLGGGGVALSSLLHDVAVVALAAIATCVAIAAHNYRAHCRRWKKKKSASTSEDQWPREEEPRHKSESEKLIAMSSKSIAASLAQIEGMEASGNFLSAIFSTMWEHANVAVSNAIKEALAPTLKDMPVPLHLVKVDLGSVPVKTTNMFIHRVDLESRHACNMTKQAGIQIDVDVNWNGNCDIILQATMSKSAKVTFGVQSIKLSGRMNILLSPLTTELPIISAVQFGFTNPPDIYLDFTGAVKVINLVKSSLVRVIRNALAGALVLPQRMVMPMDLGSYDFLDTYQPPVGMIRVTAVSGRGFKTQRRGLAKDVPDAYCKISVGANSTMRPPFRTSTKKNNLNPSWKDEHYDFVLYDMDQKIYVKVFDEDKLVDKDDRLGHADISVRDLFRSDGARELELEREGVETGCFVTLAAELFYLSDQLHSLSSLQYEGKNRLCGLATIIVTKAFDIPIPKEDAATYVKVAYGEGSEYEKVFYTGTVAHYPGVDALNPMYDSVFHVPITAAMVKGYGEEPAARKRDVIRSSVTNKLKQDPTTRVRRRDSIKSSFSLIKNSMHKKKEGRDDDNPNRNSIVFTLIDGEGTNGSDGRGELGKIMVTHESLLKAYHHTITETRPIGMGGAALEFRVILSGLQSEAEKLQWAATGSPQASDDLSRSLYGGKHERDANIRVTVLQGRGFQITQRRLGKKDDPPDMYCNVHLISQQRRQRHSHWKTSTIKDDTMPQWKESNDYSNIDPAKDVLRVDAYKENRLGEDEFFGSAEFSLEKLLRKRSLEMELRDGSTPTESYIALMCVRL